MVESSRAAGDPIVEALPDERVTVIDGDFTRGESELPGGIDVAIHSAAAVSFDPLSSQEAFQTNLLRAPNLPDVARDLPVS